ncbi:hypothetical protein GCM10011576_23390 [Micromonospora parathelypteridis]|nr:hypothetical protein GCM10011576_23390 [Micromonospora parathelypteridis]
MAPAAAAAGSAPAQVVGDGGDAQSDPPGDPEEARKVKSPGAPGFRRPEKHQPGRDDRYRDDRRWDDGEGGRDPFAGLEPDPAGIHLTPPSHQTMGEHAARR